jgi:hypothetical protein
MGGCFSSSVEQELDLTQNLTEELEEISDLKDLNLKYCTYHDETIYYSLDYEQDL